MAHSVRVNHTDLNGVGQRIVAAPARSSVPPGPDVVAPAADPVSVQASYGFTTLISTIGTRSKNLGSLTTTAGRIVSANAQSYADQELANTRAMTLGGSDPVGVGPPAIPAIQLAPLPDITAPTLGAAPRTGKDISLMVHGGPGPQSLNDAADRLDEHAADLRATAAGLHAHADDLGGVWDSDTSRIAQLAVRRLAGQHEDGAEGATSAARQIRAQAQSFTQLVRDVPEPREFDELDRKIQVADAANRQYRGMYTGVVNQLQMQRAALQQQATTAYTAYTARSAPAAAAPLWGAADDQIVGDPNPGAPHFQPVDNPRGPAPQDPPPQPGQMPDPTNPLIGDERFGHWENVVPPPYVGKNPPPPWTGHRSLEGFPGKGPAGPSGFYVPGGKTWADDNAPPFAYLQEQYRFRISGQDYTAYTRMVNGQQQQQQWVQYTYEAQRYTQFSFGGNAWAPKGPNEIAGELGGVVSGGLAGINPPPKISPWQPITLSQVGTLSAANPDVTYYIPNGCGGQFTLSGGVPTGGTQPPPTPPIMVAGP